MRTTDTVKIVVPMLPPAEYSPNSRCHWAKKWQAGEDYQWAVYHACAGHMDKRFKKARINLTVVFARHGRHDPDNLWGRFKPGMDSLVKTRLLSDDDSEHVELGTLTVEVDKARAPMTIIEIKELGKE